MATKCTVCLIGPKSAGKSSLLQTFLDCLELGGHGFTSERHFSVDDIGPADFANGGGLVPILGGRSGVYQEYRKKFFTVQQATEETIEFFFRLTANGRDAKFKTGGKFENPILLRVVDSAGEDAVLEDYGGPELQRSEDSIRKLSAALSEAQAAIIVVPLVDLETATFQGPLSKLIANLAHSLNDRPERIIVAFTQYEKLFVRAGRDAFAMASQVSVARGVLQEALRKAPWVGDLTNLSANRKVYFTVTSSYGFAKGLGIPNIEPHSEGGDAAGEEPLGKPGGIVGYWRPFLTADPFICAAVDEPGAYTFNYENLFPNARKTGGLEAGQPPRPPGGSPALDGFVTSLHRVVNWFNRKR